MWFILDYLRVRLIVCADYNSRRSVDIILVTVLLRLCAVLTGNCFLCCCLDHPKYSDKGCPSHSLFFSPMSLFFMLLCLLCVNVTLPVRRILFWSSVVVLHFHLSFSSQNALERLVTQLWSARLKWLWVSCCEIYQDHMDSFAEPSLCG